MSFDRESESTVLRKYYMLASTSSVLASCTYLLCEWFYAALVKKVVVRATELSLGQSVFDQSSSRLYRGVFLDDLSFEQVVWITVLIITPMNVCFRVTSEYASLHLGSRRTKQLRRRIMKAALSGSYSGEETNENESKLTIGTSISAKEDADADTRSEIKGVADKLDPEEQLEEMDSNSQHEIVDLMLRKLPIIERYRVDIEYFRLSEKVTVILCSLATIVFSWYSALAALAVFLLNLVWMVTTEKWMVGPVRSTWMKKVDEMNSWLLGIIRTTTVVTLCNMADVEEESLRKLEGESLQTVSNYASKLAMQRITYHTLMSLIFPAIIGVTWLRLPTLSAQAVVENAFALFVCFILVNQIHKALIALNTSEERVKQFENAEKTIMDWLALHEDVEEDENTEEHSSSGCCGRILHLPAELSIVYVDRHMSSPAKVINTSSAIGDIHIEHCKLKYPGTSEVSPVIRDMTFRFKKGQQYGIIGESGVGKSTVCNMLSGLLNPSSGSITFGDVVMTTDTKRVIRDHLVFVSQDTLLFERSIRENVLYGVRKEVPDSFILKVFKRLKLDDWLSELSRGLDTVLSGGGEKQLSGGQRQRIQLARLACRVEYCDNIEYIFLDECIAALDPRSREDAIQFLRTYVSNRTTLIVTHHYDILKLCGTVLEFGKGGILEERDLSRLIKMN